jgi:AraC-like DNA-binding protein
MSTKHITAYYLDAQDGRPANEAPLRHGPVAPSDTLEIDAVDRRQDPALIIGRIPADEPLSAGMALISQEEHQALQWRDANAERELAKRRESMEVTRFQARAVLRQIGLREQVEAMMADPATDPLAVDAWTDAVAFKRTSPTIALLASQLGLSDAELDDMFERAADIEA